MTKNNEKEENHICHETRKYSSRQTGKTPNDIKKGEKMREEQGQNKRVYDKKSERKTPCGSIDKNSPNYEYKDAFDRGEEREYTEEYQNDLKSNYLEVAQRIQAEFDNYRKRSADIVAVARQEGVIDAVMKFLPALDSIQKAKTMIKDKMVLEGVNLIEKGLQNSLKTLDVEEIESKGKHFDPKYHNVIAVKHGNSLEDGIIADVYQAGYKIKDKIIRYAQVIVNKNKEDLK